MEFALSESQRLLVDSVAGWLRTHAPLSRVRRFADADAQSGEGRTADLITGLAELGVAGIMIPESHGGVGLGALDACLVAEALGYCVAPVPFAANAVMVPAALRLAGSLEQQDAWLPGIAAGRILVGAALSEHSGARGDAGITASDGRLTGRALHVLDFAADAWLVADRAGGLHMLQANTPGVTARRLETIDRTRPVGELILDRAAAEPLPGATPAIIARVLDLGRAALAADTIGAAQCMLDQAVAYAKTREQFDRPIGSFQAVKHMCADMAAALEPTRAFLWYAGHALDTLPADSHALVCHLKAHLSETGTMVAKTATEVHGGMGFTDLVGLHYWFKRIGFNRQMLGAPERLRQEAARAAGLLA